MDMTARSSKRRRARRATWMGALRHGASVAVLASLTALPVLANPSGGTIPEGGGAGEIVDIDPSTVEVRQDSQRLIIDWDSFDIEAGETTRFVQPGADAVVLNRVTGGGGLSSILGTLEANGQVFLINPAGVLIGNGATVNVHSFVATTADISNQNFLDGELIFNTPSAALGAAIVNEGTISVAEAGLAALVGPSVRNSGVVAARLGRTVLAGAETFTLDLTGDNLISFEVPSDGFVPMVAQEGTINVDGGIVYMTAQTAAGIIDTVISMEGVVEARSVGLENGEVVLYGGPGGTVAVTGSIDATGDDGGETGGRIAVSGARVVLDDAVLDASGAAGGGDIAVGGRFVDAGPGDEPVVTEAQDVVFDAGSTVAADATVAGRGGSVTLTATDMVTSDGTGSVTGPDGGGSVLLDAGGALDVDGAWDTGPDATFTVRADVVGVNAGGVDPAIVAQVLAEGGDVTVASASDVFLSVGFGTGTATDAGNLTVTAVERVVIAPGVTIELTGGDLALSGAAIDMGAGSGLTVTNGVLSLDVLGDVSIGTLTVIQEGAGAASLALSSGGFIDALDADNPSLVFEGAVDVALSGIGIGVGAPLRMDAGPDGGTLNLTTLAGAGGGVQAILTAGSAFDSVAVNLADASHGVDIVLPLGDRVLVTPGLGVSTLSNVTLTAAGSDFAFALTEAGGIVRVASGTVTSPGDVSLSALGDLIIGTGPGVAIAMTGVNGLLTLESGGSILSSSGLIDVGLGGRLSFEATGDAGRRDAPLLLTGATQVAGTAGGDIALRLNGPGVLGIGEAGGRSGLTATAGAITLGADDVAIAQAITAATTVSLATVSPGTVFTVGGADGESGLTAAELALIAADLLEIAASGGTLSVAGAGDVDLSAAAFDVTLSADTILFNDAGTLTLAPDAVARLAGVSILGGGTRSDLAAANGALLIDASGAVVLSTALAQIAGTSGSLILENAGALSVGTVDGVEGLTTDQGASLTAQGGALTLERIVTTGGETGLAADGDVRFGTEGGLDAQTHDEAVSIVSAAGALALEDGTFALAGNTLLLRAGLAIAAVIQGTADKTVTLAGDAATGDLNVTLADGALAIGTIGDTAGLSVPQGSIALITDSLDIGAPVAAETSILIAALSADTEFALASAAPGLALSQAEARLLETLGTVTLRAGSAAAMRLSDDTVLDLTPVDWSALSLQAATILAGGSLLTDGTALDVAAPVVLTRTVIFDTAAAGSAGADLFVAGPVAVAPGGPFGISALAGTAGAVTFNGAVGTVDAPLAAFTASGERIAAQDIIARGPVSLVGLSGVTLGGDGDGLSVIAQGDALSVSGPLALLEEALLSTATAAGLGGPIGLDAVTLNGFGLTLDAGTDGAITATSVSGGAGRTGLLDIARADSVVVAETLTLDRLRLQDLTTLAQVSGAFNLNALEIAASPAQVRFFGGGTVVDFVGPLNTGGLTLGGGGTYDFVTGLQALASPVILDASVRAGGAGLVVADVTLTGDTALTTADGGPITLGVVTADGQALSLDAGATGAVTVARVLNGMDGAPRGAFTLVNAGSAIIDGPLRASAVAFQPGQGSVIVTGGLEADSVTVAAQPFTLALLDGARVRDAVAFQNLSGLTLGDAMTDVFAFDGGFSAPNAVTRLAGTVQTIDAPITVGTVVLDANTVLSTVGPSGGSAIRIGGPVTGGGMVGQGLSVIGGTAGSILLEGDVGADGTITAAAFEAAAISVQDIFTRDGVIFVARNPDGSAGIVTLNSRYETGGGDLVVDANVRFTGDLIIDTTDGGLVQSGTVTLGQDGAAIDPLSSDSVVSVIAGETVRIGGVLTEDAGSLDRFTISAASGVEIAGGVFGDALIVESGAFNGDPTAIANQDISITGPLLVAGTADFSATGSILINDTFTAQTANLWAINDVTVRAPLTAAVLQLELDGIAETTGDGFLTITDSFLIGSLTEGQGRSDLKGEIRGVRSDDAALFGRQLSERPNEAFLLNGCVVSVGCLQLDRSTIVLRSFEIVNQPFEADEANAELRFSDLGNFEIFRRLGIINIWADQEDEDED